MRGQRGLSGPIGRQTRSQALVRRLLHKPNLDVLKCLDSGVPIGYMPPAEQRRRALRDLALILAGSCVVTGLIYASISLLITP